MKAKVKKIVSWTLAVLVSIVLLYFAFSNVNWDAFWSGLKSCNFWLILATIAIQWIITLLRGNRWRLLMGPLSSNITRRETYDAFAICYLSNMAVTRSGEVVRCGLVAETRKVSFEGALGTVVIERSWDIICVFLATIPLLFFGRFRDFIVEKMFRPAADSVNVSMFWLVAIIILAIVAVCVVVYIFRRQIARTKVGAAVLKICKGLGDGVKASFKMDHKLAFFAYTIVIWIGYWLCSLWTLHAFPIAADMTGLDALFLMVVGSLGWMVPVPGGFGAYHLIVTMTLVPIYGFTYDTGMIFATISHESQSVQMLLCGLVSMVSWFLHKRKIQKTI